MCSASPNTRKHASRKATNAFSVQSYEKKMIFARVRAKNVKFFFKIVQNLVFLHILRHHFYEFSGCLIDITKELPTGSVHMSATTEDFARKDINRSVALAAEGYLRLDSGVAGVGTLMRRDLVFAHEDGIVYVFYLQGHIDYAFHVAGLRIEAINLAPIERDEGCMVLGEKFHLVVQAVAYEPHPVSAVGVEYAVVDGILVDAGSEEHGNNGVHLRLAGVVGEVAGVGHHARVDTRRKVRSQVSTVTLTQQVAINHALTTRKVHTF